MKVLNNDILPDLSPVEYETLKASVADRGIEAIKW